MTWFLNIMVNTKESFLGCTLIARPYSLLQGRNSWTISIISYSIYIYAQLRLFSYFWKRRFLFSLAISLSSIIFYDYGQTALFFELKRAEMHVGTRIRTIFLLFLFKSRRTLDLKLWFRKRLKLKKIFFFLYVFLLLYPFFALRKGDWVESLH